METIMGTIALLSIGIIVAIKLGVELVHYLENREDGLDK
jgi:ABC-type phosphate transport system permease subunit